MDRTAFAACALLFAPAALCAGCGASQSQDASTPAPAVLAELKESSPGAWRSGEQGSVYPASLERPTGIGLGSRAFESTDRDDLQSRMDPRPLPAPAEEPTDPYAAAGGATVRVIEADQVPTPDQPSLADQGGAFPELVDPTPSPLNTPEKDHEPRTLEVMAPPPVSTIERLPSTIPLLPPERGTLPWAGQTPHSAEMRAVLEQADQRLRQGFRLAERGAMYLARAEFVAVLELIAQAHDMQRDTRFHTKSLAAGMIALEESKDFVQQRPVGKQLDIERVVSGHRTSILKEEDLELMMPIVAARRYYTYAQEQLAGAAAGESQSSIALYGLGKMETTTAEASPAKRLESTAQAMVLYQAALMADRGNYRAANELGVILAKNGDLVHARNLLLHSVRLSPHPSSYRNLSIVHGKLGETELADAAMAQSVALERAGHRRNGPAVQWVDPATFAGSAPASDGVLPPVAKTPPTPQPDPESKDAPVTTARKSGSWFPWTTRR